MTPIPGTTRAQTVFLRAFRTNPAGPAHADWPTPAILRRWLRRPAFAAALKSLRNTFRFQVDFHLASAAAHAAQQLTQHSELSTQHCSLLRLAHLRQRFPAKNSVASPATFAQREEIEDLEAELQEIRDARRDSAAENGGVEDQLEIDEERECVQRLADLRSPTRPTMDH
jgi:hypothetical protein